MKHFRLSYTFQGKESRLKNEYRTAKYAIQQFCGAKGVMIRGIHFGFFDLFGDYIKSEDIISAFRKLYIPQKYIEKFEKLLLQYTSVYKISDSRIDEEELEKKIELIDKEYDKIDNVIGYLTYFFK